MAWSLYVCMYKLSPPFPHISHQAGLSFASWGCCFSRHIVIFYSVWAPGLCLQTPNRISTGPQKWLSTWEMRFRQRVSCWRRECICFPWNWHCSSVVHCGLMTVTLKGREKRWKMVLHSTLLLTREFSLFPSVKWRLAVAMAHREKSKRNCLGHCGPSWC